MQKIRCAIYTRKPSEDGLEQEFNSLHAQREACAAYVKSEKAEGWVLLPEPYDDGGLSGGTLERPALQRLLTAIDAGLVDRIVVYKIDRLTRSLSDFARIVERLDAAGASFVSVTQSFNTATSMGRLTLNMLLSFAQFEREVTAERIRDKIAASKRKGLWMGGQVPLGYDADGRTLTIREDEATTVRTLYDLYRGHRTVRAVEAEADRLGLRSRQRRSSSGKVTGGIAFDRGHIHHVLTNPLNAGRIRHRGASHDGKHPPIIDPGVWDEVQAQLQSEAARRSGRTRDRITSASPLVGRLFDETGDRLTATHTKTRTGKRLRYYVSHRLVRRSGERGVDGWRLPAAELEGAVATLVDKHLLSRAIRSCVSAGIGVSPVAMSDAMRDVAADDEAAGDQAARSLKMVRRVDLAPGRIRIALDDAERLIGPSSASSSRRCELNQSSNGRICPRQTRIAEMPN